jgi:hypothetical protein
MATQAKDPLLDYPSDSAPASPPLDYSPTEAKEDPKEDSVIENGKVPDPKPAEAPVEKAPETPAPKTTKKKVRNSSKSLLLTLLRRQPMLQELLRKRRNRKRRASYPPLPLWILPRGTTMIYRTS